MPVQVESIELTLCDSSASSPSQSWTSVILQVIVSYLILLFCPFKTINGPSSYAHFHSLNIESTLALFLSCLSTLGVGRDLSNDDTGGQLCVAFKSPIHVRDHPHMTSSKFGDFKPPPPLVRNQPLIYISTIKSTQPP